MCYDRLRTDACMAEGLFYNVSIQQLKTCLTWPYKSLMFWSRTRRFQTVRLLATHSTSWSVSFTRGEMILMLA